MEPKKTAEPVLKRRLGLDHDNPAHSTSHDNPHAHHVGGSPHFELQAGDKIPIPCGRFPDSWQHLYNGDLSNLEIPGLHGGDLLAFSHTCCYKASNVQPCRCGRYACHIDSLIIAVDGACPSNGRPDANKSACGIYFGPNNPYNMSFLVLEKDKLDEEGRVIRRAHTNQRAELRAVAEGLKAAKRFCEEGGQWYCFGHVENPCPVRHLIIKSDSAYVVDAMAGKHGQRGYAEKWVKNNFRNFKGEPVKNKDLWCLILCRVLDISMLGATVDFWHVPRAQNKEADALANEALGGNQYLLGNGQLVHLNMTPADMEWIDLPMSEAEDYELGFSPDNFDYVLKYLYNWEMGSQDVANSGM